uniref:phospholipase D-like domain-containing protein n=1 Tax=Variovorax sp. GV025 TaxID=3450240 RepID=UPI00403A084F
MPSWSRWVLRFFVSAACAAAAVALVGCATPLPNAPRASSQALPPAAGSPLVQLVEASGIPSGQSGFWPIPQGAYALDARLTLLREATQSLDLQYYFLANDGVGRAVMRELRNAAARGVRVRLLLDDLYTRDIESDLQALQTFANVEVRLFNPFTLGRHSASGRLLNFVGDFRRLNHRMHNKAFIADGALAVVGGRNLADEYFLRSRDANFIDMDVLVGGKLVPEIASLFDRYWNSEQVFPLHAVDAASGAPPDLQRAFARRVDDPVLTPAIAPPEEPDAMGEPPLSRTLRQGRQPFVPANAIAVADLPSKAGARAGQAAPAFEDTVTHHYIDTLRRAQSEIMIFSPYFVPGRKGVEYLREARDRGVEVRVITNAMSTSDEPIVNVGYQHYREQLLGMGVQLYELSATRSEADPALKQALGSSRGRLHAKMAFVDRRIVMVGSMNVDLRSAYSNTEIGVGIDSPELAKLILDAYRADNFAGVYQVQLKPEGGGVQWIGRDAQGEQVLVDEPEVSMVQRFKLWLQFLFVSEDLL